MANIIAKYVALVTAQGTTKTKKDIQDVTTSLDRMGTSAKKNGQDLFNTQDKGIIGTANSTRSFSKLARTINGGSSSVVGAYATLMSNVFALTAAFNALSSAAQVNQIEKGLEAMGARMGQTLTVASRGLKEVTGNAISAEQAMRSSSQVFSAGFNTQQLERLGKVATDASFALGRNMTDAMDRLTRGVIKLEPELLDELGIMTRLGEATKAYAAQMGKTESSLTTTERRQAFYNAVMAEGEAKFAGLSKAAGNTKAYDQLGAALSDMSKETFNAINTIGLPLAQFFSNSPGALLGGAVLFASTLKSQLLPGLDRMQEKSLNVAKAYREMAAAQVDNLKLLQDKANDTAEEAYFKSVGVQDFKGAPKNYRNFLDSLDKGLYDTDEQLVAGRAKATESLNRSIKSTTKALSEATEGTERYVALSSKLDSLTKTHSALTKATYDEAEATRVLTQVKKELAAANRQVIISNGTAQAQETVASAISAANVGEYKTAWTGLKAAIGEYSSTQKTANASMGTGTKALGVFRTATFASAAGARVLGATLLNMIPVIGQVVFVVGLAAAAFAALESKESKALKNAIRDFADVADTLVDKFNEIERVKKSAISTNIIAAKTTEIETAALRELGEKLDEIIKKRQEVLKGSNSSSAKGGFFGKSINEMISGIDDASNASKVFSLSTFETITWIGKETVALRQVYAELEKNAPKVIELAGGQEKLAKMTRPEQQAALSRALRIVNTEAEKLNSSITNLNEAYGHMGSGIEALIKKASGTTDLDSTVSGFRQFAREFDKLDPNKAADMIQGLPEAARSLLSVSAQQYLTDSNLVHTSDQRIKNGEKLSGIERINYNFARERLSVNTTTTESIVEQLSKAQQMLQTEQARLLLAQSQDAITAATLKKFGTSMELTVSGLNKKIDLENTSVKNQIKELEFSKQFLQLSIDSNKSNQARIKIELESLRNQQLLLEARKKDNEEAYKGYKAQAEHQANISKNQYERAIYLAQAHNWQQRIDKSEKDSFEQNEAITKSIENREISLRSLASEERILGIRMQAANNNIAAANLSMVSSKERALRLDIRSNEIFMERLAQYTSLRNNLEDMRDLEDQIQRTKSGQKISINETLNAEKRRFDISKNQMQVQQNAERELLRSRIRNAEGPNAEAVRKEYQRQLDIKELIWEVDLRSLDLNYEKNRSAQVYFDMQEEGLNYQKDALNVIEKQLDAQRELRESALSLEQSRDNLYRKQRNLGEKSRAEVMADEIRTATIAYQNAVRESEVKKALIDLEYALLDAQATHLKNELETRRSLLSSEEQSPANERRLQQLNNAISNLNSAIIKMPNSVAAAKSAVDKATETARTNLQAALTPSTGTRNAWGNGERRLEEARSQATQAIRETGTIVAQSVAPLVNSQELLSSSLDSLTEAINSFIPSLTNIRNGIIEDKGGIDILKNMTPQEIMSLIGRAAQARGITPSEQSSFGRVGTHGRNSLHYQDRALDLNIGRGNNIEWNNPVQRRLIQSFLDDFKRVGGFDTVFGSAGHKDHGHLELERMSEVNYERLYELLKNFLPEVMAQGIIQGATEAATQVTDIIVTGSRGNKSEVLNSPEVMSLQDLSITIPSIVKPLDEIIDKMTRFDELASGLRAGFAQLGPSGEVMVAAIDGVAAFSSELQNTLKLMDSKASFEDKFQSIAATASSVLNTIQQMNTASSQARVDAIDAEIAAEQKRDGKSAESVAKIAALEKKKDSIAKKSFETNKKLMIAQAIINTATAVTSALAQGGPIAGPILAAMIGALGAAQIALIAGTSYQSSSSTSASVGSTSPTSLTIGKRGDTVDLARNNANAGGEIGYLRGTAGTGSNAGNYSIIGSAYGGNLPRGYGSSGLLVGEKGPEIIQPRVPVSVTPNSKIEQQAVQPVQFNINTLDAKGVEDVLYSQRGNIIGMLREAANANGQRFLENVNTSVYTGPNVGKL